MFARALLAMVLFGDPALLGRPARAGECDAPARAAELALGIPADLLTAIGRVETGRREPGGRLAAWPWSVNAAGQDYVLPNAAAAVALVGALRAQGVQSIDVGCFQVNLFYHPEAFASLADAFDPAANADAAGRFLRALHGGAAGWEDAVARYHSANPELGLPYLRQVMASWGRGPVALPHPAWLPVVWSPSAWPPPALLPPTSLPVASFPVASIRVVVPRAAGAGTASPWRAGGMRLPVVITPAHAPP